MSTLFKEALTVAGIIGFAMLIYMGGLIITGGFNAMLLRNQKFWTAICGNRKDGPPAVLAVISVVLIVTGYLTESSWILGAGFAFVVFCYVKHRDTLKKDPFEDN